MSAKITNDLQAFLRTTEGKAFIAASKAMVLGASEAAALTPIDTSTLINSQFKDVQSEDGKVTATVGYTADHALAVHDPEHPQNFRRAGAEKEFLKKGFERAAPNIDRVIKETMK